MPVNVGVGSNPTDGKKVSESEKPVVGLKSEVASNVADRRAVELRTNSPVTPLLPDGENCGVWEKTRV